MISNVLTVNFTNSRNISLAPIYQYDYGMEIHVNGIELPHNFEVHFCNRGDSETKTVIGSNNVVLIPDEYLATGRAVNAYIYLHTGNDDGETVYRIEIPVRHRAEPSDGQVTPQERSVISDAIAALNNAVDETERISNGIPQTIEDALTEAKNSGRFDGADGRDGIDGKDGKDGIDGRDGTDGKDGEDGRDGIDGYTPIKGVDYFDGATGPQGPQGLQGETGPAGATGETGPQGPQGADYVLTSADKAEIAGIVSADFTTETWTFTLDDDSTVIKKVVVES